MGIHEISFNETVNTVLYPSTRRRFKVNVQRKMCFSHILQTKFYPWLSTTAMRTIRKYGIK